MRIVKQRVSLVEVDQRKLEVIVFGGKRLLNLKLNSEDAMDRSKWKDIDLLPTMIGSE